MRDINFDSEYFNNVKYIIKDNHVIINTKKDGKLAINFKMLPTFIRELEEILEYDN